MNRIVESKSLRLRVVNFLIQPSDSSIQVNFPKKNNPEGERVVRNTWILQGLYNNALLHEAFSARVKEDKMGDLLSDARRPQNYY